MGLSHGIGYEEMKNKLFTVEEDFATFPEHLKKLIAKRSDLILQPFRQQLSRKDVDNIVNRDLIPNLKDPELSDKLFNISVNPICG